MSTAKSEIENGAFIALNYHRFGVGCTLVAIPIYGIGDFPDEMQIQCQTHSKTILKLRSEGRP